MKKYIDFLIRILLSIKGGSFCMFVDDCPSCNSKRLFVRAGLDNYLIKCICCNSSIISLSLICAINFHKGKVKFRRAYELSFHGAIFSFLKKQSEHFYFSEYFPLSNDAYVNGVSNEDVQQLRFDSNSFDLVTCTEVLEHVPDYKKGLKEVCRVLDRDGYFFFTIPLYDCLESKQIAKLNKQEKIVWLDIPEFHGSRLNGPNSVPVFWHHSRVQILDELKEVGFSEAYIENIKWHKSEVQSVVVCRK